MRQSSSGAVDSPEDKTSPLRDEYESLEHASKLEKASNTTWKDGKSGKLSRIEMQYSINPFLRTQQSCSGLDSQESFRHLEQSNRFRRTRDIFSSIDQQTSQEDSSIQGTSPDQLESQLRARRAGPSNEADDSISKNAYPLPPKKPRSKATVHFLTSFAALGAVFGDLGTSPIYAFTGIFAHETDNETLPTRDDVIGVLSTVLWVLILVAGVKYAIVVMRADYNGEGGTFALFELAMEERHRMPKWRLKLLVVLASVSVALFLGDCALTPAVSILSALDGITLEVAEFDSYSPWVAVVIVILLFSVQGYGSGKVGLAFSPIVFLWYLTMATLGIYNLVYYDHSVLKAFNPVWLFRLWTKDTFSEFKAFKALGLVILVVTGVEAMYVDMGHFGRPAVYTAFSFIFPCLLLQYCGQAAYLASFVDPSNTSMSLEDKLANLQASIFWTTVPQGNMGLYYVVIILATAASIVASQSLITSAFTLMNQASALSFVPRLKVVHTSKMLRGQVYIGIVNTILAIVCIILIIGFRDAQNLLFAYGFAVSCVFLMTTVLLCWFVAPFSWNLPTVVSGLMFVLFGGVEILFVTSSFNKVPDGGWVSIVIAAVLVVVMLVWRTGRALTKAVYVSRKREAHFAGPFRNKREQIYSIADLRESAKSESVSRCDGVGIFLTTNASDVPPAMSRLIASTGVLPKYAILLVVEVTTTPFVELCDRVEITSIDVDLDLYLVTVRYGWAEPLSDVNLCEALKTSGEEKSNEINAPPDLLDLFRSIMVTQSNTTAECAERSDPLFFYVSSTVPRPREDRSFLMRGIIELYCSLKKAINSDAVQYYNLPANNSIEVGAVCFC